MANKHHFPMHLKTYGWRIRAVTENTMLITEAANHRIRGVNNWAIWYKDVRRHRPVSWPTYSVHGTCYMRTRWLAGRMPSWNIQRVRTNVYVISSKLRNSALFIEHSPHTCWSPVSIQTQSLALCALRLDGNRAKRNRLRWQAANHGCHCFDRA